MLVIGAILLVVLGLGIHLLTQPRAAIRRATLLGLGAVLLALLLQHAAHADLFGLPVGRWLTDGANWMLDLTLPLLDLSNTDRDFLRADSLVPLVLNVLVVLAAGLAWGLGPPPAAPPAQAPHLLQRGLMRDLYAALLGLGVLFLAVLPQLAPVLGGGWPASLREVTKDLFWSALVVPLALVRGATGEAAPRPDPGAPAQAGGPPLPDLDALVDMLRRRYASCLLTTPKSPAPGEAAEAPSSAPASANPAVRRILATLDRQDQGGPPTGPGQREALAHSLEAMFAGPAERGAAEVRPNPLFEEDLAAIHFTVLAELALSVQDRGGVTLVMAPTGAVGRIDQALRRAIAEHGGGFAPRSCRLDDEPFDTGQRYSLLVGSDDAVDSVLLQGRPHQAVERCLTQLGLIIVLDFHRLDAALLRLRMRSVADRIGRRPVQVVCQSERRIGLRGAAETCFAALETGQFEAIRLAAAAGVRRHVVLWRHDEPALQGLAAGEAPQAPFDWRLDTTALLALAVRRRGIGVAGLDGDERDRAGWEQVRHALGGGGEALRWAGELVRIEQRLAGFPDPDIQVLLAQDRGNLAEAVARHGNFSGQREHVLIVLAHDYALRDFLAERLDSGERPDDLLPIAPASAGGSTECAMVLAGEFARHPGGVPLQRVEELFDLIASDMRDAFRLEPTPAGIDELFRRETGRSVLVDRKVNHRHETLLALREGAEPPSPPQLTLPARLAGRQREETRAETRLPRGDHGLSFAENTKFYHAGERRRVAQVAARGVVLEADAAATEPPQRYLFHRQYRIGLRGGELAPLGRPKASRLGTLALQRALLRGKVERRTCALASHWRLRRPVSAEGGVEWHLDDIALQAGDASVLLIRYGFLAAGASPVPSEETLPEAAFTLAATLQDVLGSLFPAFGHRFAVLSPQAAPAIAAALLAPVGSAERFPVECFPRLVEAATRFAFDAAPAETAGDEAAIGALLDDLRRHGQGDRAFAAAGGDGSLRRHLDLIVIEDSDHDLGALRAVHEDGWPQVVRLWRDFVAWGARRREDPSFHYRFGASELPAVFDFASADAILGHVARADRSQAHA